MFGGVVWCGVMCNNFLRCLVCYMHRWYISYCDIVQWDAMCVCDLIWLCVRCEMMQYNVLYCTILYCTKLNCTELHHTVLYVRSHSSVEYFILYSCHSLLLILCYPHFLLFLLPYFLLTISILYLRFNFIFTIFIVSIIYHRLLFICQLWSPIKFHLSLSFGSLFNYSYPFFILHFLSLILLLFSSFIAYLIPSILSFLSPSFSPCSVFTPSLILILILSPLSLS